MRAGRKLSNTDSREGMLGHTDAAPRNTGSRRGNTFLPSTSLSTHSIHRHRDRPQTQPAPSAARASRLGARGLLPRGPLRPWQAGRVSQPLSPSVSVGIYLRTTTRHCSRGHMCVSERGRWGPLATPPKPHGNPCSGHSGGQGGFSSPRLRKQQRGSRRGPRPPTRSPRALAGRGLPCRAPV